MKFGDSLGKLNKYFDVLGDVCKFDEDDYFSYEIFFSWLGKVFRDNYRDVVYLKNKFVRNKKDGELFIGFLFFFDRVNRKYGELDGSEKDFKNVLGFGMGFFLLDS